MNEPTMAIDRQIELITERRDNALLIAERKCGDDREGWLDDAAGYDHVIASLERLKRLDSQPVPVEPDFDLKHFIAAVKDTHALSINCSTRLLKTVIEYIDTLQSALRKEVEFTQSLIDQNEMSIDRAEAAESLNKRLVELLRGMRDMVFYLADYNTLMETERKLVDDVSKLLKEVE